MVNSKNSNNAFKLLAVLLFIYLGFAKIYELREIKEIIDAIDIFNEETEEEILENQRKPNHGAVGEQVNASLEEHLYQNQKAYQRLMDPETIKAERQQLPSSLGFSSIPLSSSNSLQNKQNQTQENIVPVNVNEIDKLFETGEI